MLNTSHVLDRLHISRFSSVMAVTDVGNMIRDSADQCSMASKLFRDILDVNVRFDDDVYARVATKAMIQDLVLMDCEVDDVQSFVTSSKWYAEQFVSNPQWSFLWAQPEDEDAPMKRTVAVQVVEGIDVKVELKENGKIKKGGKQPLANEMYRINVVEAATPLTNQEYIALIMKELDMSKAGATTYAYNAGKLFKAQKEALK